MDEFLRMIKGFQKVDKENVTIPANWPENELMNDHVIVPPAGDEETAKKRLRDAEKGNHLSPLILY